MINLRQQTITLPLAFLDELSQAHGVEAVLRITAVWLTRLFPAQRGAAVFMHGETVCSSAYWTDERVDPIDTSDTKPRAGSVRERVMEGGEHLAFNAEDLATHDEAIYRRMHEAGLRAMLISPMMAQQTAVGMLIIGTEDPNGFTKNQGIYLKVLGQAAAAQLLLMEQLRQTARLAETDALTGLANRARLMRVLARMQSDGQNGRGVIDDRGQVFGLLHLDLDYFKQINDRLGHAVGDAVLKQAAARMRSVLGPRDVAARVGGDEFVVLSRSDPKGVELQKLGQRLLNRLRQPMEAEGHALEVTASIGGAVATSARRDGEALIADADIALYEVKRAGRAGVRVFDETMRAASLARDALLDALRKYGTDDAFVPHFQPLVSLRTGLFSGFELLARWNHPERGPLNPAEFMDLVEEAGLTQQLDHTVRRKGLEALRDLREAGWAAPRMSFNASLPTLQDPNIVTRLMFELSALDLSPQDLAIELREDDIASLGLDLAEQQLQALRKAGFRVELDDYGAAGSASLELLATLPISALKLDASMAQILNAPRAGAVLGALVTMADALERPVVAKGVETPEQFARLRGLGCAHAQGHGISPPLPLEELVGFMSGYGQAPVNLAQLA